MIAFTNYTTDPRVRRESESLVRRGDEVDFICLRPRRQKKQPRCEYLDGVRLYTLLLPRYRGSSSILYLLQYLCFFCLAFLKVSLLHLKRNYHIVQVHTMPDFMVFTALIPKILGSKIILDVHDLMPELFCSKFGIDNTHPLIKIITWVERHSVAFAHKALAVSKPHLDALVKHGNPWEKFAVLLNVPDQRTFRRRQLQKSTPDNVFHLVYHGTIARRHGLDVAIRAVARLREDIPDLRFSVLGDGDDLSRITSLTQQLGLESRVEFSRRFVPFEELVPFISQATMGVVPILADAFTQYMLPTKLLEYVSLGIPVIASRTMTIETYFDDTMLQFFQAGDAEDLAERILSCYRDPHRRDLYAANADRFNRQYNWEGQRSEYYSLIDSLLRP